MSFLVIPDTLTAKFDAAEEPIPLCAADGRVLGYFTPNKPRKIQLEPPASDEELLRRLAAGGGRPLADILRDLEAGK